MIIPQETAETAITPNSLAVSPFQMLSLYAPKSSFMFTISYVLPTIKIQMLFEPSHPYQIQSVEVESGKVQVKLPEDHIRLKKQEQIYLNRQSGEYSKLKRCGNKIAVWRKGALYFHQTPLVDVARELERRYHCRISFREGQPFDNLISGEHDNQNLESILESLHYICGIKYEKEGENIVLYK